MAPRTSSQFQEIREEKMNLIMEVALRQFANEGYHKTTISQIARHAGISKGLMYNYFEGKEDLLMTIIRRSVDEMYSNLDLNRDGILSEEEFEYFVRRMVVLLKERQNFWRLLIQLFMQNEARAAFLHFLQGPGYLPYSPGESTTNYLIRISEMFTSYFMEKKNKISGNFDPDLEFEIFLITMKGLALKIIFSENQEEIRYESIINRIIDLYK